MDLIYTDTELQDVGVLQDCELDIDLADAKDFELKTAPENAVMTAGCYWYIEGTEYGGRVDRVKVDTSSNELIYGGRSWRGMLASKVVSPPDGKEHLTLTGPWQEVVQTLIDGCGLSELFEADAASFDLDDWQVARYVTLLDALAAILSSRKHRISLIWTDGKVRVGAVAIRDLTDTVQYETDDKVHLVVEDNRGGVNHLICLGKGDGTEREVVHLYTTATGAITELQQTFTGLDEIVQTYENTSAETREKLKESGFEHLKGLRSGQTFSVSVEDYDVQIGDIVGGKESITGIQVAEQVTNIIYRIDSEGQTSIEYKVGENA